MVGRAVSAARKDKCAELGPWGAHCTDWPGHRYSHYDASDDVSWQDDWREITSVAGGGTWIDDDDDDDEETTHA